MDPSMLLPNICFAWLSYRMLPPCQPHPNSLIDPRTTWRHHQQTQKPYQNIPDMSSHSGSVCFILWDPFPNELLHDLSSVIPSLYFVCARDKVINKQLCRTCIYFHLYIHIQNVNLHPPDVGVRCCFNESDDFGYVFAHAGLRKPSTKRCSNHSLGKLT